MNKDSIYKLIGYNGEYNANIKKAIKKLLKENHPDNNGNRRIFELINEVKDELENNKVSYNYKNSISSIKENDDIDYLYCSKMIDYAIKEKNIYTKSLEKKKGKLLKYKEEYKDYYNKSVDLETIILSNTQNMDKLNKIKVISVILLVISILVFVLSIWKKSVVIFSAFVVLVIICILIIHKSFYIMNKITENNKNRVKNYVGINNNLRVNQKHQNELKKEILELDKKINNCENDLRFYENILKNRG